jgi:hypothetical protein
MLSRIKEVSGAHVFRQERNMGNGSLESINKESKGKRAAVNKLPSDLTRWLFRFLPFNCGA